MKITFLVASAFFLSFAGMSQAQSIQRCATIEYMNHRENVQPGYIQSTKNVFDAAKSLKSGNQAKSDETYIIPVVVHVVYNKAQENIDDSVIFDQIRVLNEDYKRQNADSVNLRAEFLPYAGKANIEFKLANFDPNGIPTTGITRTQTTKTSFLNFGSGLAEDVKSTAAGGIDPWNQSRYLNIWVCNMALVIGTMEMPMVLGYATPPDNLPNWPAGSTGGMSDGVVIQYQVFGSNNPTPLAGGTPYTVKGRTVTHEVGHYLGLRHIWGDGDCSQEDGIDDTPNADSESSSDCVKTKNTCVDAIDGVDLPDLVENYMDYSAEDCQNTFTKGQVELMRGVIENNRWDLVNDNDALAINKLNIIDASLYPNPANSSVTLSTTKSVSGNIVITDINGKVVKEVKANGLKTIIDVSDLNNGFYQITIDGVVKAQKFVKL
ncbi:MAG: zinc-dependent metalloprotease [Crocinitomicaceae bacterium]|nr:zinc-dependent metalloprotease [Crocinitomicaceae bacterium]